MCVYIYIYTWVRAVPLFYIKNSWLTADVYHPKFTGFDPSQNKLVHATYLFNSSQDMPLQFAVIGTGRAMVYSTQHRMYVQYNIICIYIYIQ